MKTIMDAVHGQLVVPKRYCSNIIDTPLYQRLKRVEQTFASSIFPTATHNRFMHSLGVFHIGRRLFYSVEINSNSEIIRGTINQESTYKLLLRRSGCGDKKAYDILRESYYVACLLHDCGHAPFSHTFENFYLLPKNGSSAEQSSKLYIEGISEDIERQCAQLSQFFGSPHLDVIIQGFIADLKRVQSQDAERIKAHEYVSSWLILHAGGFLNNIANSPLFADPLLVCRMIMGIPYNVSSDSCEPQEADIRQMLNCYISLLNGNNIDADRIDYAARDQWAMGVSASSLNLERLLTSIRIDKCSITSKYEIIYRKQAMSELRALSKTKTYSMYWVFNHHKFKLLENYLVHAVRYLSVILNPDIRNQYNEKLIELKKAKSEGKDVSGIKSALDILSNRSLRALFDYHSYIEKKSIGNEVVVQLCDDDIISMLKRHAVCDETHDEVMVLFKEAYNEWFSRSSTYLTVWKSYSEYVHIFKGQLKIAIMKLYEGTADSKTVEMLLNEKDNIGMGVYKKLIEEVLKIIFKSKLSPDAYRIIDVSGVALSNSKAKSWVQFHNSYISLDELVFPDNETDAKSDSFFYLYVKKSMMTDMHADATSKAVSEHILSAIEKITKEQADSIFSLQDREPTESDLVG